MKKSDFIYMWKIWHFFIIYLGKIYVIKLDFLFFIIIEISYFNKSIKRFELIL